jgi:hypothetical protein
MKRFAKIAFDLFLFYQVMEGVIKYALALSHLTPLIHIFKFLLVASICLRIVLLVAKPKASPEHFLFTLLLCVSIVVGLYFIPYKSEVVYCLFLWLPFLFGFYFSKEIDLNEIDVGYYKFLLLLVCVGLFVDFRFDVPWQGFSYESFGQERVASREWNQFDLERPAGFSGLSWSAASLAALLGVIVLHKIKSGFWKFFYGILVLAALLISTTKGAIFAFLAVVMLTSLPKQNRSFAYPLVIAFSIFMGLVPYFFTFEYPSTGTIWDLVFYSFFVRLVDTWPLYYDILQESGSFFFGKGMGGVGGATFMNFDINSHSSDSFFLYTLGLFGIPGLIFFYSLIARRFMKPTSELQRLILLAFMVNGMVVNGIEFGVWGLFFGLVLGARQITYEEKEQNSFSS